MPRKTGSPAFFAAQPQRLPARAAPTVGAAEPCAPDESCQWEAVQNYKWSLTNDGCEGGIYADADCGGCPSDPGIGPPTGPDDTYSGPCTNAGNGDPCNQSVCGYSAVPDGDPYWQKTMDCTTSTCSCQSPTSAPTGPGDNTTTPCVNSVQVTYNCLPPTDGGNQGDCIDPGDGTGQYKGDTALSDCQTACYFSYDCDTDNWTCSEPEFGATTGQYSTLAGCEAACVENPTYDCDTATGACYPNGTAGQYASLDACQENCQAPGYDCIAGQCVGGSTYSTLADCQAVCTAPPCDGNGTCNIPDCPCPGNGVACLCNTGNCTDACWTGVSSVTLAAARPLGDPLTNQQSLACYGNGNTDGIPYVAPTLLMGLCTHGNEAAAGDCSSTGGTDAPVILGYPYPTDPGPPGSPISYGGGTCQCCSLCATRIGGCQIETDLFSQATIVDVAAPSMCWDTVEVQSIGSASCDRLYACLDIPSPFDSSWDSVPACIWHGRVACGVWTCNNECVCIDPTTGEPCGDTDYVECCGVNDDGLDVYLILARNAATNQIGLAIVWAGGCGDSNYPSNNGPIGVVRGIIDDPGGPIDCVNLQSLFGDALQPLTSPPSGSYWGSGLCGALGGPGGNPFAGFSYINIFAVPG